MALLVVGCAHNRSKEDGNRGNECRSSLSDTTLGPGDVFDVRVYEEPQLSATYRVAADGTISFPLIGTVNVDGKAPQAVGKEVEERLAQGFLRSPQVSLFVKEYNSKKISVLGQVQKPGTFPYIDSMTVIEALTLAGGFTNIAAKNDAAVTRTEAGKKSTMQVRVEDISEGKQKNLCLRPGDIVFIPERMF